jgi:intracellular sulfur oxidation DsrE/DsrF family protein
MHQVTRVSLAVLAAVASVGAKLKAELIKLHMTNLAALVDKADARVVAYENAITRLEAAQSQAAIDAAKVAADAAAEAATHGATLPL